MRETVVTGTGQAVFVPGYYSEVGAIARTAARLGLKVPLLGGDGWDAPDLIKIGGDALDGCYFSNHYSVDDPSPRIQEFVAKFKKAYGGQVPDSLAAQAYDAAGMLYDAMKRANDISGPAVRDALAQTKDYRGVTGDITMDDKRNATKPAVVLRVGKGGKYVAVMTSSDIADTPFGNSPQVAPATIGTRICMGWNGTAESASAVFAALPWLQRAR